MIGEFGSKNQKMAKVHKKIDVNYEKIYDLLKITPEIDLINNPNVKFLMVWTEKMSYLQGDG